MRKHVRIGPQTLMDVSFPGVHDRPLQQATCEGRSGRKEPASKDGTLEVDGAVSLSW